MTPEQRYELLALIREYGKQSRQEASGREDSAPAVFEAIYRALDQLVTTPPDPRAAAVDNVYRIAP